MVFDIRMVLARSLAEWVQWRIFDFLFIIKIDTIPLLTLILPKKKQNHPKIYATPHVFQLVMVFGWISNVKML